MENISEYCYTEQQAKERDERIRKEALKKPVEYGFSINVQGGESLTFFDQLNAKIEKTIELIEKLNSLKVNIQA